MKVIQDYLQSFSNDQLKVNQTRKLLCAVKYYLSRACCTVRDPRIIQLNHYVDKYFTSTQADSKHIVLSPTKVPFPISYLVNFSLIKNDESKLFYINDKEEIVTHPYEYCIPVFLALFSGTTAIPFSGCAGKLFVASIVASGEIAMKLVAARLLQPYESVCCAVVLVVASLWNLSRPSVVQLLDDIDLTGGHLDMQACLQAVNVACCQPHWFTRDYVSAGPTEALLCSVEADFGKIDGDLAGLDSMKFCLLGLSPIGSLLAATLYESRIDIFVTVVVAQHVHKLSIRSIGNHGSTQQQLSRFVSWNRSRRDSHFDMLEYSMVGDTVDMLSIEVVDELPFPVAAKIKFKDQNEKEYSLSEMSLKLGGLDHLLMPKIEWDIQVVLGVCAAEIVLENINTIFIQSCLVKALEFVYSRPGLD